MSDGFSNHRVLAVSEKLFELPDSRITSRRYAHLCDKTLAKAVETYLPGFGEPAMPDNVVSLHEEPV